MTLSLKTISTKAIALTLATSFAATTALPVATAEAGHKKHWKKHHHVHVHKHKKRKHRNNGDALAAGVIGFAIGAIIADQASRNRQPDVIYVKPRPQPQPIYTQPYVERRQLGNVYSGGSAYDHGPNVIRYEDEVSASYEPWTPAWAEWCDNRYRSFNINTGTFRGYDGKDHFCVVK